MTFIIYGSDFKYVSVIYYDENENYEENALQRFNLKLVVFS